MTTNPTLSPLALSAALLERAKLDLCFSDGDPESRGVVIQPDELPRLGCRFAALRSTHAIRIDAITLGDELSTDHRVYRPCAGIVRGQDIGGDDVLDLLRHMLGLKRDPPEWSTRGRVRSEVHFLLIERKQGCCEAHQDTAHRAAWIGRVWLAEYGSNAVGATNLGATHV